MKQENFFFNCSKGYVDGLDPSLFAEISGVISQLPKRQTQEEINNDLFWLSANLPCSKRLKTILPLWIPGYLQSFGPLPPKVLEALSPISPATIDRILSPTRIHYQKRGRSTTKPGTLLRNQIPIKTNQWEESRPGFLEADTVAHCGDSLTGMFAYTLLCYLPRYGRHCGEAIGKINGPMV
jgi:hypothetical protein